LALAALALVVFGVYDSYPAGIGGMDGEYAEFLRLNFRPQLSTLLQALITI